ncbi:MAG: right-handed parallel beta-helix repeat-containing protein [Planctomycetes bacterium]|nr:right-handed parallel beta-helix repeat-containing protein [Planctomycetota bacterium]
MLHFRKVGLYSFLMPVLMVLSLAGNAHAGKPDFIIPLSMDTFDGAKAKVKPGDTIAIMAGKRVTLKIINVCGTEKKPVTVINKDGVVEVANKDRGYAIAIQGCAYLRFTGTGSKKDKYGIRCATERKGMMAFHVNGKSTDIEVDHVEVFGAGFAGFNVKDEPKLDKSTNRDNFVMYNISLHDNYVHDVSGEGFYIGHTFYGGWKEPKTGTILYPHLIKGLRVYNNIIHNAGCEAIQIGSADEDVEVFGNVMVKTGCDPFAKWQDNGLQIGSPTTGSFHNNIILDAPGNGIVMWGDGTNKIYDNVIARCGGYGIYVHKVEGKGYVFASNTIAMAKNGGIRVGNSVADSYVIKNNFFVLPDSDKFIEVDKRKLQASGNVTIRDLKDADFLNPEAGDFRIGKKSAAEGKGGVVKEVDVDIDMGGNKSTSKKPDAGAWQYSSKANKDFFSLDIPPCDLKPLPFTKKDRK